MSAAITLACAEHLTQIGGLIARRRVEGTAAEPDTQAGEALAAPLLQGGPEGAIWLVGPPRAPLGYAIVTFGWSLSLGGREAWIEDVFVRDKVRRRGIGREVMHAVARALRQGGVQAINVRIGAQDTVAKSFCEDVGLSEVAGVQFLTEAI